MGNIYSLVSLAGAVVTMLGGCGATDKPVLDTYKMGDGFSNRTALGGYWYTYVDRTLKSEVVPDTGKFEPTNAEATALKPPLAVGNGKGIEMDGSHMAYHVTGKVAPVPSPMEPDPYWDALYGDLCKDGKCGELKYPSAGVGFGFKDKNVVLGDDAKDREGNLTKGIGFRMRLGANHAKIGSDFRTVAVSAPMDLTDAPDKSYQDEYGSNFAGLNSTLYPNKGSTNYPICSFPNTIKPDGVSTYSDSSKTCFCNLTKTIPVNAEWQTICIAWEEFHSPGWGGLSGAIVPNGGITSVIPERLIKLQFDAYKPTASEEAAAFDFWLDDVRLLSQSEWDTYCASKRL